MARDVFISYKTEDREAAQRLCAALEHENISCWLAPRDIPPGQEWATSIVEGLQRSRLFVLLLSKNSTAARQIAREAELADKQGIPIITFRLEDIQPPPSLLYFLGNIQWLDGFGGQFESSAARLADIVRQSPTYPAEKSAIHRPPVVNTAPIQPAPQPVMPPPVVAAPVIAKNNSTLLLVGGGALLVVIALVSWFGLRPKPTPADTTPEGSTATSTINPSSPTMLEAKAEADKFLEERDSGNYDAAWKEYEPSYQAKTDRAKWQETNAKRIKERGAVTRTFAGCSADRKKYLCNYTLTFQNGSVLLNELWVVPNGSGGWSISDGAVTNPPR